MRNALVDDLLRLPGVWVTCATAAPAPRAPLSAAGPLAQLTNVAPNDGENALTFVLRQSMGHDAAWVIAPESGGLLSAFHTAVGARRWIGCDADAIRIASGKRATRRYLHRAGVATPLSLPPEAAPRWVVKPDDGAGCTATRLHAQLQSALTDLKARPQATLERFVDGEPLSVTVLASADAVRPLACNRQQIEIDADGMMSDHGVQVGQLDRVGDARVPALHAVARAVVHALPGLRGVFGIDLVWHPQRGPVVIEVNPRLTCAYVGLSELLAMNVAGEALDQHLAGVRARDALRAELEAASPHPRPRYTAQTRPLEAIDASL